MAITETTSLETFRRRAELCRVLTDPKRLLILDALGCTMPNTSQHVAQLRSARLVASRREGTTVYYRLAEPRILDACDLVGAIADRMHDPESPEVTR